MIELAKAKNIYINNKHVASLTFGESKEIQWPIPPVVPATLTLLDNYKIKIEKGNKIDIYNLSYDTSKKTPNYSSFITVVDPTDNVIYYVSTVTAPDSSNSIPYDNKNLSHGWYSETDQSGSTYSMWSGHYTRNITNGWYFGYGIENRLAAYPLDNNTLDEAIRRANCVFPSAHIKRVSSSTNYFEMNDYEDTWLALCTSGTNSVKIQFNHDTMTSYYGAFTTDKTSNAYKQWLGTMVHELGHTFGSPDQASHYPSIYDYSRDRTKALYLQANDIAFIKHAYCDKYGCDPSIFDTVRSSDNISADAAPRMLKARSTIVEEFYMNFDYGDYDSVQDLAAAASNIVTGTLTFNRKEKLNIGGDLELDFDIYTINIISEEKGTLTKKELKVHPQENNVKENQKYRLYLKEYKNTPCSLVNVRTGLVEIL